MREIKFRAWDREGKKMHHDVHDNYGSERWCYFCDCIGDEDCILMQYAGLRDKNSKEIYEGDILKYSGREIARGNYTVEWKYQAFIITNGKHDFWGLAELFIKDLEVIGNIYENPELSNVIDNG